MKKYILLLLCVTTLLLTACSSSDDPTKEYRKNMDEFFKEVSSINESINSIDTNDDGYAEEIVSKLYELDTLFSKMSAYEVPDGFPYVQQLSTNASSYMSKALTYYRNIFNDGYDEEYANIANAYYEEANKDIKYIIRILHGESYEEFIKNEPNGNEILDSMPSVSDDEDDYSMYLEEDDNDYTVYNDPDYVDDLGLETTEENN